MRRVPGARVINDPRAVRDHNEKFSITEFPELTTEVLVSRDAAQIRAFVEKEGEAVLKLLDGMGGASIFRARADDPNLSVILETMNQFGARTVMCQRYLPAIADGDKRILLIGGEVVPHAIARVPKAGESRGNLAAGGTARAQPLSARDRAIGEQLAPVLLARGLFVVGLDVIGDSLTEINVTSPTCFREIADQAGFDVGDLFVRRLEASPGSSAGPRALVCTPVDDLGSRHCARAARDCAHPLHAARVQGTAAPGCGARRDPRRRSASSRSRRHAAWRATDQRRQRSGRADRPLRRDAVAHRGAAGRSASGRRLSRRRTCRCC